MSEERNGNDLSEIIAENFGANATYVEGLLNRYRSNPSLVDEAWRTYFTELLGEAVTPGDGAGTAGTSSGGNGSAAADASWPVTTGGIQAGAQTQAAGTETQAVETETHAAAQAPQQSSSPETAQSTTTAQSTSPAVAQTVSGQQPAPRPAAAAAQAHVEPQPIRGGALKIVENMETSLTVPTATSNRQVPVKVLEENRSLVNQFLKEHKRGKASYTHFIAFAILRALERFPQMNDGFAVVDGSPARLRRTEANLGLAIDLEKKDGTRT
ncbi:MAG: multifunctional 2-oxoglutarate metabolism enzyme, partial [Acidobacteriota bacterium]|nr:multifunctional 2-oxoglutarate metabolism enzyme [Acidobacteriota bacterium]